MKVLLYHQIQPKKIHNFNKVKSFLEQNDFQSAQVKKLGHNLYRAKLDRSNRLLFAIYRFQDETYALILELIQHHAYERSRFLKGVAHIDEAKIPDITSLQDIQAEPLNYLNINLPTFNLLDKIISFDEIQHQIYQLHPPLIIIGSAGSGKTVLTLEKMKEAVGDVLYVTRSPYLVHNAHSLYYALNYENDEQQLDFLSFEEYLSSIRVPQGREMTFREFAQWFSRHRKGIKDAHQVFEEFKGVLTGSTPESAYLSRAEYLKLGVKQSIFLQEEREQVYDLFTKYLEFMQEKGFYDANIISYDYLQQVTPRYDFIVVDEVQDLTTVQLQLILKSLNMPHDFMLCGDSNQIVHPNFFSWSKIKTLFYQQKSSGAPQDIIRILNTNYRNSPEVTEVANRLLKIKNSRFGAIDRESNYLVKSNAQVEGQVMLLADNETQRQDLNQKTQQSTRFAVIVMHPEQKATAKQYFNTPLIFAVQEAKGLEYENVVLYNFVSTDTERFRAITRNVTPEDLVGELTYARAKDKTDKSLEIYKFYINALYVAMTRAVKNIYLLESDHKQYLFELLGVQEGQLILNKQDSSLEEWHREARKLELQGKQEQADDIRSRILKQKPVPWDVIQGAKLDELVKKVQAGDKKAKLLLFEYALVYHEQQLMNILIQNQFSPAKTPEKGIKQLNKKYFLPYELKHPNAALRQIEQYGVNFRNPFNQTPLMIAARLGNASLVEKLIEMGAEVELVNNNGFNAFQIVLEQACVDTRYANQKLTTLYPLLQADSITIQVDEKLVKLDNHLMEFLMLNLAIVLFYLQLGENVVRDQAFNSSTFMEALAHFPERIVPQRRKKRAYISSILSKNEVNRVDKYNRKLFYRIKQGQYIINPNLSIRIEGVWNNIYDLLSLDKLTYRDVNDFSPTVRFSLPQYYQQQLAHFRSYVNTLRKGEPERNKSDESTG